MVWPRSIDSLTSLIAPSVDMAAFAQPDKRGMTLVNLLFKLALILIILAAAGYFLAGPERIWNQFGNPDLGPVAFETLERRTTPNDALACPPGFCSASSDITSPLFAIEVTELRRLFQQAIAEEPLLTRIDADDGALTERYIQRSSGLRFPDTINIRYIDRGEGRSTLALYSRSQIGRNDLGVNRARLERWLGKLEKLAPSAQ